MHEETKKSIDDRLKQISEMNFSLNEQNYERVAELVQID